jgi:hypothetical protein
MIQKEKKYIKEKEPKRKSSRKVFSPYKTFPHQTKMKSVKVIKKSYIHGSRRI